MKDLVDLEVEYKALNALWKKERPENYLHLMSMYPTATSCCNCTKNRYADVLPYEHTRVRLNPKHNSDYINANYINRKFISCQAPLPNTFEDFWRMIWEQNCGIICMLTKLVEQGKVKADCYWPDCDGSSEQYGEITVTFTQSRVFMQGIEIRLFKLKKGVEVRDIVQLHYSEWEDFGVPETTLKMREFIRLIFMYKERSEKLGMTGPLVAHCSAGIGRTGVLFAILIALEKQQSGDQINLMEIVHQMRKQRAGMVQTFNQYYFVYRVLVDLFSLSSSDEGNDGFRCCRDVDEHQTHQLSEVAVSP